MDVLYGQFQAAFEEYYDPLCQYAFSFVKDGETAEDIVQEVFARIWEKRKDLIGSGAMRFYLFTAVRNNSLTHLKASLPVRSLSGEDIENKGSGWEDPDDYRVQETVNYRALLEKGIAGLPPKCKEVFLLSRMGQLSNREVAQALRISVKTVENQLWKAMKMLRDYARNTRLW